ncbi:hypothetical protein [Spiroplasma taiwanense]|uniref:Uncharacterized protein n=1 Tax=Spiroplasma taiwanense CT-1 TaxID=1276220 RepID=S5LWS4_9MOLU|nr:hypothetical protein [Spiroplasma taiwanense]AGR41091.1 hypothetical protein STAIW_v1c04450 [Spiroplasma taiwanense CT-1]
MSIFNQEENNKKITWPEFKFKTGKQIEEKIEQKLKKTTTTDEQVSSIEMISTQESKDKVLKENKVEKTKIDEILNIPAGSILRIDGEEYQIHISISPGQEVTKDYIHKKVIDPNGLINKWEYKNASLSYDKEDNIFYYVIESPKKG